MNEIKQRVLEEIERRRGEIIGFLKRLIRFPSVTGEELGIQRFIAKTFDDMDLQVDVWELDIDELKKHPAYEPAKIEYEDRPNVVGVYKGRGGGRSLLFNGHVDVCSPGPREAWRHDPFGAEVEGGRLYGRGASDMKSGLASMIMALRCVLEAGVEVRGDVVLECVVDEEYTSNGTLGCVLRGYRADAAINCEASDMEVQPAQSGSMWFEVLVRGRSASMSRIWEHVSPIEQGYKVFRAIQDLYRIRVSEKRHPLYPDPRGALGLFVGVFTSGDFPSNPPELCVIKGRMGILPNEKVEEAQREFIEFLENRARLDPWLRFNPPEVSFKGYLGTPSEISPDHPICTTVKEAFREALGREPLVKGHEGASDMRVLVQAGIPTLIFGPGTITQMHAMNEWVRVEDVVDATKVMALTILKWCGYEEEG